MVLKGVIVVFVKLTYFFETALVTKLTSLYSLSAVVDLRHYNCLFILNTSFHISHYVTTLLGESAQTLFQNPHQKPSKTHMRPLTVPLH